MINSKKEGNSAWLCSSDEAGVGVTGIAQTLCFGLVLIGTLVSVPVVNAEDDEDDNSSRIQEVIIHAERREVDYQDLAGTAISFTGDDLKMQGLQNITDLAESVVGLEIGNNQGNIEVYIRGVGSSNNTELGDPAAAFHFDDIYVPRPNGIGTAFFDIQNVEVNIGPQGTLRGRNATAGSINVRPWRPGLGQLQYGFEAEAGNYKQRTYNAFVNIPIGEKVAARLALFKNDHDSYYNDVGPQNIETPELSDDFGARLQFYFEPTDDLRILLAADYISEQGTGYTGTNFAAPLGAGVDPNSIADPRDVYARGFAPLQDTVHWGAKFQLNYDLGFAEIEYIAGMRDLVYDYAAATPLFPDFPGAVVVRADDNDDLPLNQEGFARPPLSQDIDNFSRFQFITDSVGTTHELRLVSPDDQEVFYSVGIFYFEEDQSTFLGSTGDRGGFFQGNEFNQPNTDTESVSVYGDMTWKITDQTRFTAGIRFTDDHKERVGVNAQYSFLINGVADPLTATPDANGNFFDCCLGLRVGTEGFQFEGPDRDSIVPPNFDGEPTELSTNEYIAFYLGGIKQFGARDTIDEFLYALLDPDKKFIYSLYHDVSLLDNLYPTIQDIPCEDLNQADSIECPFGAFLTSARVPNTVLITPQSGEIDDSFVDWRLRIEHDITEDHLTYFLIATGHKSGGFNDNFADDQGVNIAPTYGTEKVTLYELGSKNEFEIASVPTRLNASLFYSDYTDQVFTAILSVPQADALSGGVQAAFVPGDPSLGVSFSFNAADSRIYGAQFDGAFFFDNEFTVKWQALWLEAEIEESRTIQDFRFQQDVNADSSTFVPLDGNRLPHTPQFQFNVSFSQVIELDSGSFDYVFSAGWRDEQFKTILNSIDFQQPDNPRERLNDRVESYWTFDGGAGYSFADSNLRIETYVNNITNEVRPAAIIITQFDNTRFFTRPRTFGIRARWSL